MEDYSLTKLALNIEFAVEDYSPLLVLFLDATDLNLLNIRIAAAAADDSVISTNLHNIKGSSLNMGLDKITGIIEQLSNLNRKGDFDSMIVRVEECEEELNKLRELLR